MLIVDAGQFRGHRPLQMAEIGFAVIRPARHACQVLLQAGTGNPLLVSTHAGIQACQRAVGDDIEPHQLRQGHGGFDQLVLLAHIGQCSVVIAVQQVDLGAVDMVVGDTGTEFALAHGVQAGVDVEVVATEAGGCEGLAEQVALHLQEQTARVQGVLIGALAHHFQVLGMQATGRFQVQRRVPDHAVQRAVSQVEQIAGLVAGLDPLAEPGRQAGPMVAPVVNEHGVNVDDPGAQAQVVQAFVDRQAYPAVFIAQGRIIQLTAQQHAVGGVGKGGLRAVAPVQGQIDGLEHQVAEHVAAGEECGGKYFHQQSHGGQGGGIVDDRRINQISDPAARQVVCHQPFFQGDLFRAGVFAEVDTQQRQALDCGPDGGLHSAQCGVLPAADGQDVGPLQIGCGVLEHLLQPAIGLPGAAGQIVGQLHFGGQGGHHRRHARPGIGGQQFLYHLKVAQGLFIS